MRDTDPTCTPNARIIAFAHQYSPMIGRVIEGLKMHVAKKERYDDHHHHRL
jgi:hypothetical protein